MIPVSHAGDLRVHGLGEPFRTVTSSSRSPFALVTAFLARHFGERPTGGWNGGAELAASAPTVTVTGWHLGEVRAFLIKYYGTEAGQAQSLLEPLHTIPTRDRFGLVIVHGEEYLIADIGMRMLTPRELFRAQGFPASYIIDPIVSGKPLSKTEQIAKCGNSVCPPLAAALVRAQFADLPAPRYRSIAVVGRPDPGARGAGRRRNP